MPAQHLHPAHPATAAASTAWLDTRLRSGPHAPTGFAAAARLLHPATDEHQRPATWAQVAARTGDPLHPAATWEQVAGTAKRCRGSWSQQPACSSPPTTVRRGFVSCQPA